MFVSNVESVDVTGVDESLISSHSMDKADSGVELDSLTSGFGLIVLGDGDFSG